MKRTIATGLYGKVKLAIHLPTGEDVVIKVIERKRIDSKKFREHLLLRKLKHKHIVNILEVIEVRLRF